MKGKESRNFRFLFLLRFPLVSSGSSGFPLVFFSIIKQRQYSFVQSSRASSKAGMPTVASIIHRNLLCRERTPFSLRYTAQTDVQFDSGEIIGVRRVGEALQQAAAPTLMTAHYARMCTIVHFTLSGYVLCSLFMLCLCKNSSAIQGCLVLATNSPGHQEVVRKYVPQAILLLYQAQSRSSNGIDEQLHSGSQWMICSLQLYS